MYIAYVLVFSVYYTYVLYGDFRFQGVLLEDSFAQAKDELASDVRRRLLSEVGQKAAFLEGVGEIYRLKDLSEFDLTLTVVEAVPGTITFAGYYTVYSQNTLMLERSGRDCRHGQSQTICRDGIDKPIRVAVADCQLTARLPPAEAETTEFACMTHYQGGITFGGDPFPSIGIHTTLSEKNMQNALALSRATTDLKKGLFARMVYFSAVTSTTLGYGDIVPITTAARLSIALQSLGGLFLIGFFLVWITDARTSEDA